MFNNWLTTVAGLGAIFTGLGHMFSTVATGDTSSIGADLPAIFAGFVGLFAKDFNVTGVKK